MKGNEKDEAKKERAAIICSNVKKKESEKIMVSG